VLLFGAATAVQAAKKHKHKHQDQLPSYKYKLLGSFKVKGRLVLLRDNFYYVSGSKAIYKYDKKGNLVASNENPFDGYAISASNSCNHIGDIDVFNGEILSARNGLRTASARIFR